VLLEQQGERHQLVIKAYGEGRVPLILVFAQRTGAC